MYNFNIILSFSPLECGQFCTYCNGNGPAKCDDGYCIAGSVFVAETQTCSGMHFSILNLLGPHRGTHPRIRTLPFSYYTFNNFIYLLLITFLLCMSLCMGYKTLLYLKKMSIVTYQRYVCHNVTVTVIVLINHCITNNELYEFTCQNNTIVIVIVIVTSVCQTYSYNYMILFYFCEFSLRCLLSLMRWRRCIQMRQWPML